jgi:putative ABC transport system permease protein
VDASLVPASGSSATRPLWRGDDAAGALTPIVSMLTSIDTAYFRTMGIPLARGRGFGAEDRKGTERVVIVSQSLARRLWADENPVGKTIAYGSLDGEQTLTVVGIAGDTRNRSPRLPPSPQIYLPLAQSARGRAFLHVRLASDDAALVKVIREAVREAVPEAAPVMLTPIRSWMSRGYADMKLVGILGGVFALLALALASTGIYGLLSYEAARRRREYGVHLALGASPALVRGLVLRRALAPCVLGMIAGMACYAASMPMLTRLMGGRSAFDPLTLLAAVGVLTVSAALAALVPAISAGRSDPMRCLRAD